MVPQLTDLQKSQAQHIKQSFDFCSEILDEYFEPYHVRFFRTVTKCLKLHRTHRHERTHILLIWTLILLFGAVIVLSILFPYLHLLRREAYYYDSSLSSRSVMPLYADTVDAQENQSRIDINRANADELCKLPGIGPVLAQRIIDERNKSGYFHYAADLLTVSGIGEKTLKRILPCIELSE